MTSDANITLSVPDTVHMAALVGPGDKLLRLIEESFRSNILVRGNRISITGARSATFYYRKGCL